MEFFTNRDDLLTALQKVVGVVERNPNLPILNNLFISASNGSVVVKTTDLEMELQTIFAADVQRDGEVTVPARKLYEICRNLNADIQIRLRVKDDKCLVTAGRSRFNLGCLPVEEFPNFSLPLDEPKGATEVKELTVNIQGSDLRRAIDKTAIAMAKQDVRFYLNGMLLDFRSDKLISVATDGHRLAKFETPLQREVKTDMQAIVPSKAVSELKRQLSGVADDKHVLLNVNNRRLQVTIDTTTLVSKLIDGQYPDYERVIPQETKNSAIIDKELLKRALLRTTILANEKYRGVTLSFAPETLGLKTTNPNQEEAEEEIAIDYIGEPVPIGFNHNYLIDLLAAITEPTVQVLLNDCNASALWRGVDAMNETFIVMPMRI